MVKRTAWEGICSPESILQHQNFLQSLWPYSPPLCRANCMLWVPWAICPSAEGLEVWEVWDPDMMGCILLPQPKNKGLRIPNPPPSAVRIELKQFALNYALRRAKEQGQHCFTPRHWRANCPTSASRKDSSTGIMITGQDALINHLKRHPNAKCCNHQASLQLCGLNFGLPKYANGNSEIKSTKYNRNSNCWPKHLNRTLDPQGCPLPSHFLHHFQTIKKK